MGSEGFTVRKFTIGTFHSIFMTVIKSRRLEWARHVARMEEGRNDFKMLTSKHMGINSWFWVDSAQ